eukprot:scaffold78917_cov33-Tisochrysis_lutea.AAC.8
MADSSSPYAAIPIILFLYGNGARVSSSFGKIHARYVDLESRRALRSCPHAARQVSPLSSSR